MEEHIGTNLGSPHTANIYAGASRRRDYYLSHDFTTHSITRMAPQYNGHVFPNTDEWVIDYSGQPIDRPPTVRAVYPKLLRDQLAGQVTPTDAKFLSNMRIRTKNSATPHRFASQDDNPYATRYAGPYHIAHWLAIPPQWIDRLIRSLYCINPFHPRDASSCGHSALCPRCTSLTEALRKGWNFQTVLDLMAYLMLKVIAHKQRHQHRAESFDFTKTLPHECPSDDTCQYIDTWRTCPRD